jgi:hypothetical protein
MAKKVLKKAEQGTSASKLKPGQVTVRRAYELSDSLAKTANKPLNWEGGVKAVDSQLKSQDNDREKSQRLKTRADEAIKKAGGITRDYRFDSQKNDRTLDKKKMGGKVAKKMVPKMMMKTKKK